MHGKALFTLLCNLALLTSQFLLEHGLSQHPPFNAYLLMDGASFPEM